MESFELKIAIEATPDKIFAALTDPKYVTKWDNASWVLNPMCRNGKLRKRDEDGFLTEGEIVTFDRPGRYAYLWPVAVDPEDPEEETFLVRFEFSIDNHGEKSLLTLSETGFPSTELAEREKNTWGGYTLEKIKKLAESVPAAEAKHAGHKPFDQADTMIAFTRQGHVRRTERATHFES
jgi:uncharacterized protein YndB with AHSA1/START domain